MGKIGDLVNRIISPLLNRSTDSEAVADPRRGRIGYVGNITLISQLINDAGYSTDNGTVTDVHIKAGPYIGITDDAPDPDEFIPNFQVPTKTSNLTNDGNGSTISQYGTGTITGLTKNGSSSGVTIENGVAKIKIGTDMNDYENDNTFSRNPGTMISLAGQSGLPHVYVETVSEGAIKYIIQIPTRFGEFNDLKYVNKNCFENIYKFVFNNITVNNSVITPIGTLYNQTYINSYFKIYTFGKIVFIYGQVPSFTIPSTNTNGFNNMQILEIKKSDIFMKGPSVSNSKIVGNGILGYKGTRDTTTYVGKVPIYIEYNADNKLSMVTCDPLNGDSINKDYGYPTDGSFFAWWYTA